MANIRTRAGRIAFEVFGSGPPIVLIRGLARSRRYWLGFDQLLGRSFTVLSLDNRGLGQSGPVAGSWCMADLADDTVEVLQAAGFERSHILGISLGGMVAQELAIRHPGAVDHLLLGSTTPGGREGISPSPWAVAALAVGLLAPKPIANKIAAHLTLSGDYLRTAPHITSTWRDLQRTDRIPRLTVAKQFGAVLGHRAGPRLSQVKAPTLVFTGDHDLLINPANSQRLVEMIPRARLHVFPGGGHDLSTERPEEMAHIVEQFCVSGEW